MSTESGASASDTHSSRPRYLRLAFAATLCAAAALYVVTLKANDPGLITADAERQAALALDRIGYRWAKVRVYDGVAHLSGEAPGEPERVLAYETVYKALRPAMTQTMTVSRVASHLTLPKTETLRTEPAAEPAPAAGTKTIEDEIPVAAAPSGTTWRAADANELPRVPAEAMVYAAATPVNTGAARLSVTASAPTAAPAQAHAPAPIATAPAARPITTAAIDKPAIAAAVDCKAELAEAVHKTHVSFDSTSARIRRESLVAIDRLAAAAKRCAQYSIAVLGHTDVYGDRTYNLSLSHRRADAVREALIARGVTRAQVTARGLGEARPVARSAAASARNRRIEFAISEAVTPGKASAAKP